MKLNQILPGLYVRGHLRKVANLNTELRANDIEVVVGLVKPLLPVDKTIEYLYLPLPDGRLKRELWGELQTIARQVIEAINSNKKTLIYCNAGRNRSCLLAAILVSRLKGFSGLKALHHVRKCRPRAVANKHFESYLIFGYGNLGGQE